MLTADQVGAAAVHGHGPHFRQPLPTVRQAAERKLLERLREIQATGKRPARLSPRRDPIDAYLPSEEEIAAQCERFRAQRVAELV